MSKRSKAVDKIRSISKENEALKVERDNLRLELEEIHFELGFDSDDIKAELVEGEEDE